MTQIVYEWNPFQERVDNDLKQEVIKTASQTNRVEWVPRAAPFFSRNFKLWRLGSPTPLVLGVDYCFGHEFSRFVRGYNRNCFGSVIMLKPVDNEVLLADYSSIGGPFVLDQIAFATLVANIINSPRIADWADLVDVPTEFPSDPHPHPAAQTYDYEEFMTNVRSLILAITDQSQGLTVKALLEEHMAADLIEAHFGDAASIGLDFVANMGPASNADLEGSSGNKLVTIAVLKEAFRKLVAGTLALGAGDPVPNPPTSLKAVKTTVNGAPAYTLTISGGSANNGGAFTYRLAQSGTTTVVFSKSNNIAEGEQVTFVIPAVAVDTLLTISAMTVDSIGAISGAISTAIMIPQTVGGTGGITNVSADTTLTAGQKGIVIIDASAGTRLVTLPLSDDALGVTDFILRRLDNSGNTLTVAASGTNKIKFHTHLNPAGYSFLILMGAGDYWHLRSDGAGGWIPVSRYDNTPLGRPVMDTIAVFNPGGYGPLNGPILQRASLPWLWDHAQQSGMLSTEAARAGNEGGWTSGNGSTTFRGPEARGRFPRIWSEGATIDGGRPQGSTQNGQLEAHAHNIPGAGGFGTQMQGGGANNYSLWVPGVTSSSGGNETRPTNVAWAGRIKMI